MRTFDSAIPSNNNCMGMAAWARSSIGRETGSGRLIENVRASNASVNA